MRPLRIRPRALREIDDAFEWYRKRSPQAAGEFLEQLDDALALIAGSPEQHHVVRGRLRRVLLQRFPYGVYYKVFKDIVSVVGVIHGHRHPRNWLRRAAP